MLVERIWTDSALRNFNYLVACPDSGAALAIDPLVPELVMAAAAKRGWTITQVLNTHEHGDHTAGNAQVIAQSGARLLAPKAAGAGIAAVDTGLVEGDRVQVGDSVVLEVIETPGHTMCHISLLHRGESPTLFCGDTIANAGVGNCYNGGDPETLYHTFADKLFTLPGTTRIYPGHEYFANNLRFTLDREPNNQAAHTLLTQITDQHPDQTTVTTLDTERTINVFFRLNNPQVINGLHTTHPEVGDQPTPLEVFLALRDLRDRW